MSFRRANTDNISDVDRKYLNRKGQSRHSDNREPNSQWFANTEKRIPSSHEDLPPEVMGLIFRRCLDGEKITLPICYDCSTVTMPWVLGQVCSRWRDILMNDSTIWSSLNISYENVHLKEALTRRVEKTIFPRTKLDVMSLTLSNTKPRDDRYINYSSAIRTLIMPNLARFRDLTLSLTRAELEPLITSTPGSMKSLTSLKLTFVWSPPRPREHFDFRPHSITAFADVPMLRKVHFSSHYFCEFKGTDPLTLPWSQLTDINISINLPYLAVIKFLPYCTQLVNCWLSIGNLDGQSDEGTFSRNITLPHLQSITLSSAYSDTYACPNILRLMILPALKQFTLYLYDESSLQDILLKLISRSGCQLERFTMTTFYDDALSDVARLLEVMPSLQRLVIPRDCILPESTITRMIAGELAPALEAIHCQVASLPLMLQLLESRNSGKTSRTPQSYRGIRCSVLWGHGMSECQCDD